MRRNELNRWALSFTTVVLFFALVCFMGCGGGGGGGSHSSLAPEAATGVFVDAAVEGLAYSTATQSGITDSAGRFAYLQGETVVFSIGTLVLGQAAAKELLSPVDLVPGASDENDGTVTNICRLLQSLDQDADPGNGIRLTPQIQEEVSGRLIDFNQSASAFEIDPDLLNLLDSLNARQVFSLDTPRELCSAESARAHLRDTLSNLDRDGDGYAVNQGDCNDRDPSVNPDAAEVCGDGIDQDCSGADSICSDNSSDFESQLLDRINAYRSEHGLEILDFETVLNELAREHSLYMVEIDDLNHDGFYDRADRSGLSRCVENVGWNYHSPEAQFEGWHNSSGHNQNMLNAAIEYVGIAKEGAYVTFLACGN